MTYQQRYQQRKAKAFGEALDSYERYKNWLKSLVERGKITESEMTKKLIERAKMLNL